VLERIPIRIRLSLGHAVWMALIFVGIGMGVFRVVEESVLQSLDTTLLTSAKTIRDAQLGQGQRLSAFHDPLYWESMVDEFFGGQRYVRAYAQLVETSGKVRARTSNIRVNLPVTPLALSRAERGLETYESFRVASGGALRQLTLPIMRHGKFTGELIQVGSSMSASLNTINSVKMMLWITLSLGLVISVFFGYMLTKWSFKPVARITQEVGRLGFSDHFDRRLKLPVADDELRVLVKTFNEMLGRIDDVFGRLRRFAGDVSHELRTPLSVLRGEAELALRRERTPAEYQSSLRTIVDESSQMSNIVENLLLLARAQGNAISMAWEEVELTCFVQDLENMVRKNFEDRQIQLVIELNALDTIKVRMASGYFILALKNLLLNACKHSAPGQTVHFAVEKIKKDVAFIVRDDGEGIPKEVLPYIFDMFFRADTARNRSSGGVGIGLSLAKALVNLHHGRIDVYSEAGQGATFTVRIPQEPCHNFAEPAQTLRRRIGGKVFARSWLRWPWRRKTMPTAMASGHSDQT
jgi:signal transduction histidine kinase